MPCMRQRLAQFRRQRVDRAAFDAAAGNNGLAPRGVRAKAQRNALERLAFKTVAENFGPGDGEAAIGRPKPGDVDAFRSERLDPRPVRPQPRPACAAKREHGGADVDGALPVGCLKQQATAIVPSNPAMAQRELHAHRIQPPQPRPQQRRRLECLRKHPAAGADKGFLPQRLAPVTQRLRRKRLDRSFQVRRRLAIAREELRKRFAVGEIEPAPSGHQEFSTRRRHGVVDGDVSTASRQHSAAISPAGPAPTIATLLGDGDMARV